MAQAYLSDFDAEPQRDQELETEREPPAETPHPQTASRPGPSVDVDPNACLNCGTRYDIDFRRVFGDNENRLHACPACESRIAMKRGKGAGR